MIDFIKDIIDKTGQLDFLIVGDSIGDGSCSSETETKWISLLQKKIADNYNCKIRITNVAVGGTESLFGYQAMMKLNNKHNFDIIFICYGENDDESVFALTYEVLLRNIRRRYPNAYMVSFLESSQRTYTTKIKTIISLAKKYETAIVDTIEAFEKSEYVYEQLTTDGVHINDLGAIIYADAAYKTITHKLLIPKELCEPDSEDVKEFDYYRFVSKYDMQCGLADYRLTTKADHILFACFEAPSADGYRVEINGEEVLNQSFKHNLPFIWERIYLLESTSDIKKIKITLMNETDVNLFKGLILTGRTKENMDYSIGS